MGSEQQPAAAAASMACEQKELAAPARGRKLGTKATAVRGEKTTAAAMAAHGRKAAAVRGDKSVTTATMAHGQQRPPEEPRFAGLTLAYGRFSTSPSFAAPPRGGRIFTSTPRSNSGINLSGSPSLTSSTMARHESLTYADPREW